MRAATEAGGGAAAAKAMAGQAGPGLQSDGEGHHRPAPKTRALTTLGRACLVVHFKWGSGQYQRQVTRPLEDDGLIQLPAPETRGVRRPHAAFRGLDGPQAELSVIPQLEVRALLRRAGRPLRSAPAVRPHPVQHQIAVSLHHQHSAAAHLAFSLRIEHQQRPRCPVTGPQRRRAQ